MKNNWYDYQLKRFIDLTYGLKGYLSFKIKPEFLNLSEGGSTAEVKKKLNKFVCTKNSTCDRLGKSSAAIDQS